MKRCDQSYTKKMQLRLCQDLGWDTSESYLCYDSWMTGNQHASFVRYSVRYSLSLFNTVFCSFGDTCLKIWMIFEWQRTNARHSHGTLCVTPYSPRRLCNFGDTCLKLWMIFEHSSFARYSVRYSLFTRRFCNFGDTCLKLWMIFEHSSFVRYSVRYSLFTPPLLQLWRHLLETLNDIRTLVIRTVLCALLTIHPAATATLATLAWNFEWQRTNTRHSYGTLCVTHYSPRRYCNFGDTCLKLWMTANEHSSFVRYSVRYSLFTPPLLQLWRHLLETLNDSERTLVIRTRNVALSSPLFLQFWRHFMKLWRSAIGIFIHFFVRLYDCPLLWKCKSITCSQWHRYLYYRRNLYKFLSLAIAVIRLVWCTIFRLWFLPT